MYQSNGVSEEVTTPSLPKISHQNLHSLENNSASSSTIANELISIAKILPLVITGVFLYFRSFISMLFLRRLGDASFAGGSMALAFSNISGYSVFSGLTVGVESICSQAFLAKRYKLVRATIRRGIILLLVASLPISLLWINIEKILIMFKQDKIIASQAHTFMLYSVPDLIVQSFLHPLRAYLRTQSKSLPLSICTAIASVLHLPITYFLESYLNLGIKSIALSGVISNLNLVAFLFVYFVFFEENLSNNEKEEEEEDEEEDEEVSEESCGESWREWKNLLSLAIPSCISICLQLWWCYEIMILMCAFLINPKATVASMRIFIQITSFIYNFPHSLRSGVSTRVGNELGHNTAAFVGLGISIALGFTALLFTVLVKNIWTTICRNKWALKAKRAEELTEGDGGRGEDVELGVVMD